MPIHSEATGDVNLEYVLVRSRRRTLSLQVRQDGSLEVRCPLRLPQREIDRFIRAKAGWIERKRQAFRSVVSIGRVPEALRHEADAAIRRRVGELLQIRGINPPAALRIRDQRSRWGSCSSRGAISLNRRCAMLPVHLQEYVYLHELCHLRHMNHGADFWQQLETYLPGARQFRRELNQYRLAREEEVDA